MVNQPKPRLKLRGFLICETCSKHVDFASYGEDDQEKDGGWPLHRCGHGIAPFTYWTLENPRPALAPGAW